MENVNSTAATTLRQQQHFQLQQEQLQQQQQNDHQQQFCLRWHNHQTSLLSALPILLDQSHLTDVTISAEGRTLRAHRVVLSACSTFFLELFRTLDATNHPVIILPGASFAAIVALLTFMYSGEVNVYEEQIPLLLNLAETLGVKGLADVQNNKSSPPKRRSMDNSYEQQRQSDVLDAQSYLVPTLKAQSTTPTPMPMPPTPPPPTPPTPHPPQVQVSVPPPIGSFGVSPATVQHPFTNPLLVGKFPSQLENFFLKSLQFYPNLLPQPLNFSQNALNKTTELLAKYQQQCNLYQGALSTLASVGASASAGVEYSSTPHQQHLAMSSSSTSSPNKSVLSNEDHIALKRFCTGDKTQPPPCSTMYMQQQQQQQHQQPQQKDNKRIDKIADSLRGGIGSRQSLIVDNSVSGGILTQSTQAESSLATTLTNTSCSFTSTTPSKSSPIFTPTAATTVTSVRNQSPQQHTATMSSISNIASFDKSIEEQSARNLHQRIEQLANCSRSCDLSASGDVGLTTSTNNSNAGNGSNLMANQQKVSSTPADKFNALAANKTASVLALPTSPGANAAQGKTPSNSKLYATCFICHKQLSNQYNLRVHLETHQNVRYACNVCSHVSRSKDALRKHVSYRHPGAPSPCETEARRKRASKILLGNSSNTMSNMTIASSPPTAASSVATCGSNATTIGTTVLDVPSGNNSSASSNSSEAQIAAAAAHLNSAAAYMFLPNQFHLAAAAAAVVQQQQQQQQQQKQQTQQQKQFQQQAASKTVEGFMSSPTTNLSGSVLEVDTTAPAAASSASIKLEQNSPSSAEAVSNPPTPQVSNNEALPGGTREVNIPSLQRSSPA